MSYRYRYIIPFCVFSMAVQMSHPVYGQGELQAKNFNHQYDPDAEMQVHHIANALPDRVQLFLKLTIRHNRTRIEDLSTTYAFLNRYSGSLLFSKDTIKLNRYWVNNNANQHYFNFEISNPNSEKILILRIYNHVTENEFYYDIVADPEAQILNSGIILKQPDKDLPYLRNYLNSTDYFRIESNRNISDSINYVYYYSSSFPVAIPPFSSNGDGVSRGLEIDSMYTLLTGQRIKLENAGLYFLQQDSTNVNGYAFRIEYPFFPRITTHDDLVESLVYLATNSEMTRLRAAKDKERAFQEYWLDVADTPERAKRIIRDYYQRISKANELFTNYKQGWKTDMGMIFTIFGAPDVVHKDDNIEEWIYERSSQLPRISFEFQKIESIFTHGHFVLVRTRSYQQIWYKAIDLWRKGQKEI